MKKLFTLLLLPLLISCGNTERYVRSRVVKLTSSKGSCTGEQVHSDKTGKDYILTAAHCELLSENGYIYAQLDDRRPIPRRVIEVSDKTDLMLLEGIPNLKGLEVAKDLKPHQLLSAYTHGFGYATYRSVGEYLELKHIPVLIGIIRDAKDEATCSSKPKFKAEDVDLGFFKLRACILNIEDEVTTLSTAPGSSGGALVNFEGEVVGIVSAGGEGFTYAVNLSDIREFLSAY